MVLLFVFLAEEFDLALVLESQVVEAELDELTHSWSDVVGPE